MCGAVVLVAFALWVASDLSVRFVSRRLVGALEDHVDALKENVRLLEEQNLVLRDRLGDL